MPKDVLQSDSEQRAGTEHSANQSEGDIVGGDSSASFVDAQVLVTLQVGRFGYTTARF